MSRACVALSQNGVGYAPCASLLVILLVFGEGTVSASFTKFEGLGKYLGNVPILVQWSFVSALESSSLLKLSPPPFFGDDASATPSLWVKLPAGWEMFIAEYGDLDEFGLVLFSVDTVSESSAISGIETDSKGYLSVNFDTLVLETNCGLASFALQKQQQPLAMRFLILRLLQ